MGTFVAASSSRALEFPALADANHPGGVADLLRQQVRLRPHSPAVFFKDKVLSYADLGMRARGVSTALFEAGIRRGEKVGALFPNHPDFVATFFGIAGIGATVVPLNPFLKADEIEHILFDSDAKAIVVHEDLIGELIPALEKIDRSLDVFVFSYDKQETRGSYVSFANENRRVTILDDNELARKCDSLDLLARQVGEHGVLISAGELAVIVYTSGTTGKPKGAMLSQSNLIAAVNMKKSRIKFSSEDRVMAVLPLCHIYGLCVVMLGMISQGGAIVVLERFEPKTALSAIQDRKVTIIPAVPAMYQFMAMEIAENSYDLSSLRFGLCGAAPIEPEMLKKLDQIFGVPILEGYALTETACIATITPLEGPRKFGSVGPKIQGVDVRVVDAQMQQLPPVNNSLALRSKVGTGNEEAVTVDSAHIGEIAVKGPNIMEGYYKQPAATADCIKDGWFLTGDLGYFDQDGYLYICGRTKEMIIRGGQNIYPREIESVIVEMDEVIECAVVGVPDKFMGERVKAVVVVKPGSSVTEDSVKDYCSKRLASFKVPRIVELRSQLPRNSTGKVLKRLLV